MQNDRDVFKILDSFPEIISNYQTRHKLFDDKLNDQLNIKINSFIEDLKTCESNQEIINKINETFTPDIAQKIITLLGNTTPLINSMYDPEVIKDKIIEIFKTHKSKLKKNVGVNTSSGKDTSVNTSSGKDTSVNTSSGKNTNNFNISPSLLNQNQFNVDTIYIYDVKNNLLFTIYKRTLFDNRYQETLDNKIDKNENIITAKYYKKQITFVFSGKNTGYYTTSGPGKKDDIIKFKYKTKTSQTNTPISSPNNSDRSANSIDQPNTDGNPSRGSTVRNSSDSEVSTTRENSFELTDKAPVQSYNKTTIESLNIPNIPIDHIPYFTDTQISWFSPEQVSQFTPDQVVYFTKDQLLQLIKDNKKFSDVAFKNLTQSQGDGIQTYGESINKLDPTISPPTPKASGGRKSKRINKKTKRSHKRRKTKRTLR
jgi:hypothetical protein